MQLVERKLERYLKIMCYSDSREIVFMSIGAAKAISDLLLDRGNGISITVKIN